MALCQAQLNLNSFENDVDATILSRGINYYSSGYVASLEETDERCYEAVVEGTDDYTVTVSLAEDGDIIESFCDCPYDFGEVCKHEVAVYFAIRKDMEKPAEKKPRGVKEEKANLKELLEAQAKETLVDIIYTLSESDRALRQALLLRFAKLDDELELGRKLIQERFNRYKKRGYIEWRDTDAALAGAWEVLSRAEEAARSDSIRAVKLCSMILSEAFIMLDYCDDSDGSVGSVISQCIETIRDAVREGQNGLPKQGRDELFDMVASEAKRDIYEGWTDYRLSFWECLLPMAGDSSLYQKLWGHLEEERKGVSERENYYEESVAELQYELLKQGEGKEKSRKFLLENLHYRAFRRKAIDEAIKKKDYKTALRYAQEGVKNDKKKHYDGYVREWSVASYEAYKAMGNTEKMHELAEHFVKHDWDGMDYYGVLKDTTPPGQWSTTLQNLITFFESQSFPSDAYTRILVLEKDYDRLMALCRKRNSRITEFGALFPEKYRDEVEQIYREVVLWYAKGASDRNAYRRVCQSLKEYGGVCGKKAMNELAQKFRDENPRRPAFLDELSKLK